jgi:L-malate glycosyltransferase
MRTSRKRIRILFTLIQLNTGGTERIVLDLLQNLNRSLFEVYVAFFLDGSLRDAFSEACNGLFQITKKRGVDPEAMMRVFKIIKEKEIDVVNAHHYMCFFYSFVAGKILSSRALVYTEHSVPEVEEISGIHRFLSNLFMYRTNAVVGVSKEIAEVLSHKFPAHSKKTLSIPNSVDVERFNLSADRERVRAEFGLDPDDFVVGTIANFRRVKNHVCLIRAFGLVREKHPNARLVLVGRGYPGDTENSEGEVRRLIGELQLDGCVVMAGYRENIPEILQCFDVFCLPSLSEGLPVSALEAMAAKVPVVGSDVRGIREIVLHGATGMLFPSNDDRALSRALDSLIRDNGLRRDLREKAFAFVSQTHGMKQWISAYEGLFQSICHKGGHEENFQPNQFINLIDSPWR